MLVTWLCIGRIYAEDDAPDELADRTVSIVIKRIHELVLEASSLHEAIPPLPHGRRALINHVKPRREPPRKEQVIGNVHVSPMREFQHHARGRVESGGQAPVVPCYRLDEVLRGLGSKVIR